MKKFTRKQNFYPASSPTLLKFRARKWQPSLVFYLAAMLTLGLFFSSCKNETIEAPRNIQMREITDDLGRRVKVAERVERAVSLAPNLTEIAFAVGAGDRLVGVTTFCDYPLEAREIRKIGDTINPNIETIISLQPQIVLVSTASQIESFTKQLEAQNIAVFVTNPNSLDDIYKSIEQTGEIFGKTEQSRAIVENLQKRVRAIEAKTNRAADTKVFLQISKEPLYTIGKDSFLTDLIRSAGGASATADLAAAYTILSKETALVAEPDAIILSESDDNLAPNDVFKNSPAVKNGKVFHINAELLSRPGPRIVDGLEQMAKALHPENFK